MISGFWGSTFSAPLVIGSNTYSMQSSLLKLCLKLCKLMRVSVTPWKDKPTWSWILSNQPQNTESKINTPQKPCFIWTNTNGLLVFSFKAPVSKHLSIFINVDALRGCNRLPFFCNKVTVCVVILGIETAVAIVTHQTTCRALISVPWTALSPFHSLSHPHTVVQCWNTQKREGWCFVRV